MKNVDLANQSFFLVLEIGKCLISAYLCIVGYFLQQKLLNFTEYMKEHKPYRLSNSSHCIRIVLAIMGACFLMILATIYWLIFDFFALSLKVFTMKFTGEILVLLIFNEMFKYFNCMIIYGRRKRGDKERIKDGQGYAVN